MSSELATYRERIDHLRTQVRELVAGLPVEALNWLPLPAGDREDATNSLAVLAAHVAGSEHFWIGEVVGGRPPTRDRDAEFATRAADSRELVALLDGTAAETAGILSALPLSALDGERQVEDRRLPVRWCLMHVAAHTALHLGHMQLTYQLWVGGKSWPTPFWHEILEEGEGE
jgi:uncharacterized damage-inducible protein DinB